MIQHLVIVSKLNVSNATDGEVLPHLLKQTPAAESMIH
ncbi:hypothetical protein BTN50_0783 [Candidatus Enterovibrio altilux]|uniref:Uncharacterized protein n=1 Tax=Candidatus Enterovibrio altilux TaxID=1927128 RepID=A0A291B8G4_9GAMM|nr:hypothetical protein BTN50_0783 [Candidatus Enterovibrio luxaltus]